MQHLQQDTVQVSSAENEPTCCQTSLSYIWDGHDHYPAALWVAQDSSPRNCLDSPLLNRLLQRISLHRCAQLSARVLVSHYLKSTIVSLKRYLISSPFCLYILLKILLATRRRSLFSSHAWEVWCCSWLLWSGRSTDRRHLAMIASTTHFSGECLFELWQIHCRVCARVPHHHGV